MTERQRVPDFHTCPECEGRGYLGGRNFDAWEQALHLRCGFCGGLGYIVQRGQREKNRNGDAARG